MFDITYRGGNCVVIAHKGLSLMVDPKLSLLGLKDLNVAESVVLVTEPRMIPEVVDSAYLVIDGPGEYEVGDFSIRGLAPNRHVDIGPGGSASTIYTVDIVGVRMAIIGNITDTLGEDQIEALGMVDIAILPIGGGGYTLDFLGASKIVHQIDPRVVIPVHYNDKSLNYEVLQAGADEFIAELGVPVEEVDKFKFKSPSSLPDSLKIVKISRS